MDPRCHDKDQALVMYVQRSLHGITRIRDIPEHATFREQVQTRHWLDKLEGFSLWPYVIRPILTICNIHSNTLYKYENGKEIYGILHFCNANVLFSSTF